MHHFPFFLAAFPETAIVLSRELWTLLEDVERSALWQRALTLIRHLEDIETLTVEGCATAVRAQYESTMDAFILTIPESSDLWFCFGLEEYLRNALEDVVAYEALGEPFKPYGGKMLRCQPGNSITLTRTLDPVGYAHASKAQRAQVEDYIDYRVKGTRAGRRRGRTKYFRNEQDFREAIVKLMKAVDGQGKDPTEALIAELFIVQVNSHTLTALSGSNIFRGEEQRVDSMVRYFQELMKDYGLTWEKMKQLAGIPNQNTSR